MYVEKKAHTASIIALPNSYGAAMAAVIKDAIWPVFNNIHVIIKHPETSPSNFMNLIDALGTLAMKKSTNERGAEHIVKMLKRFVPKDKLSTWEEENLSHVLESDHIYIVEPADANNPKTWAVKLHVILHSIKAVQPDKWVYVQLIDYNTSTLEAFAHLPLFVRPMLFNSPYLLARAISSTDRLVDLVGVSARDPEIFKFKSVDEVRELIVNYGEKLDCAVRKTEPRIIVNELVKHGLDALKGVNCTIPTVDYEVVDGYTALASNSLPGGWSVKSLEKVLIENGYIYGVGYSVTPNGKDATVYAIRSWLDSEWDPLTKLLPELEGYNGNPGMIFKRVKVDDAEKEAKLLAEHVAKMAKASAVRLGKFFDTIPL